MEFSGADLGVQARLRAGDGAPAVRGARAIIGGRKCLCRKPRESRPGGKCRTGPQARRAIGCGFCSPSGAISSASSSTSRTRSGTRSRRSGFGSAGLAAANSRRGCANSSPTIRWSPGRPTACCGRGRRCGSGRDRASRRAVPALHAHSRCRSDQRPGIQDSDRRSASVPPFEDGRAYLGLTSRRWQSGSSIDVQGHISRAGDGDVRHPLYEAANGMLTRYRGFCSLKA
jgi:Transposase IS116/IS110/IS902 family